MFFILVPKKVIMEDKEPNHHPIEYIDYVNKLKNYLEKNQITQTAFAKLLGTHRMTLNAYLIFKYKIPQSKKKLIEYLTNGEVKFEKNKQS